MADILGLGECHHLTVPQELADAIIDHLRDNPQALAACSLVCRAWLPRSRCHLFRSISITPRNCATLLDHLISPPAHTFEYIRVLKASTEEDDAKHVLPNEMVGKVVRGIAAHATLNSLCLHAHTDQFPAYIDIAASTTAFAHITALTLKPLAPSADVAPLLCAFPRLTHLTLHSYWPFNWMRTDFALSPLLHTLVLDFSPAGMVSLAWLANQSFPALRRLHIHSEGRGELGSAQAVRHLLKRLAPLEALTVEARWLSYLDLARARPQALVLTFRAIPWSGPVFPALLPMPLAVLADTTCVTLDFAFMGAHIAEALRESGVRALDAALVAFPALREVRIVLPGGRDASLETSVRAVFVSCEVRGLLDFAGPGDDEESDA